MLINCLVFGCSVRAIIEFIFELFCVYRDTLFEVNTLKDPQHTRRQCFFFIELINTLMN